MRSLLLITAAIVGLSLQARAEEPQAYDESLLPRDEAGLRALDDKQLRIVRRATSLCDTTEAFLIRARATQRPCVISSVNHAIDDTDDAALKAYHSALPFNVRYDRYRPAYYYQQILVKYAH